MRNQPVPFQYIVYAVVALGLVLTLILSQNTVEERALDLALRTTPLESPSRKYVAGREPGPDGWKVGLYGRGARFEAVVPTRGEVLWAWDNTDHLWWLDEAGLRWFGRLGDTFTETPFGPEAMSPSVAAVLCTGVDPEEEMIPPLPLAKLAFSAEQVAAAYGKPCPGW